MADYYHILGVSSSATKDEIQKAFRGLAVKYHPDKNPGNKAAEEQFKVINTAYQVLSDPQKRNRYDAIHIYSQPRSNTYGSPANPKTQNQNGYRNRAYTPPPPPNPFHTRPHEDDSRKVKVSTKQWWSILAVVTIAVVSLVSWAENHLAKKEKIMAQLETQKHENYEAKIREVNELLISGRYESAFHQLHVAKEMHYDYELHASMEVDIINEAWTQGSRNLENQEFDLALNDFSFCDRQLISEDHWFTLSDLRLKIANCYIGLGYPENGIKALRTYPSSEEEWLQAYINIGDIYWTVMNDTLRAQNNYYNAFLDLKFVYKTENGIELEEDSGSFELSPQEIGLLTKLAATSVFAEKEQFTVRAANTAISFGHPSDSLIDLRSIAEVRLAEEAKKTPVLEF